MSIIEWFRSLLGRNAPPPPPGFGGAGASGEWTEPKAPPKLPRGIRNRNPGNIRGSAAKWQGQAGEDKDGFCIFATEELGIRALARLLLTYQFRYKLNTVESIIRRWAPPNENNTTAYRDAVARALGVTPWQKLDLMNRATMAALVRAIIKHECGIQPYPPGLIASGVDLAYEGL